MIYSLYNYTFFLKDPVYSLYLILGLFKMLFKIILFENKKKLRLHFFFKGVINGFKNQGGPS